MTDNEHKQMEAEKMRMDVEKEACRYYYAAALAGVAVSILLQNDYTLVIFATSILLMLLSWDQTIQAFEIHADLVEERSTMKEEKADRLSKSITALNNLCLWGGLIGWIVLLIMI